MEFRRHTWTAEETRRWTGGGGSSSHISPVCANPILLSLARFSRPRWLLRCKSRLDKLGKYSSRANYQRTDSILSVDVLRHLRDHAICNVLKTPNLRLVRTRVNAVPLHQSLFHYSPRSDFRHDSAEVDGPSEGLRTANRRLARHVVESARLDFASFQI